VAAGRGTLRRQIAQLEAHLGSLVVATYPRPDRGPAMTSFAGPRLLSLGELECVRDDLASRLSSLRAAAAQQAERQAGARRELDAMLADPRAYKWCRLANADLGRPGCTTYYVRPKAGVLGLLMGWWQVKVSGGCPLSA
jgi:hypothetical protein